MQLQLSLLPLLPGQTNLGLVRSRHCLSSSQFALGVLILVSLMQLFTDLWFMKSFQLCLTLGKGYPESCPQIPQASIFLRPARLFSPYSCSSSTYLDFVNSVDLSCTGRGTCSRPHSSFSSEAHFYLHPVAACPLSDWTVWRGTPTHAHSAILTDTLKQRVCARPNTFCSFLPSLPRLSHIFHSFASVGVE